MENKTNNQENVTLNYNIEQKDGEKSTGTFMQKSEEEKKKEDKSRRIEKIIGAVGDGISSVSDLIFTTQYAPSMNNAGATTSKKDGVKSNSILGAVIDSHKRADSEYQKQYEKWLKEQDIIFKKKRKEAEEEQKKINDNLWISDDICVSKKNWNDKEYIAGLYDSISDEFNYDEDVKDIIQYLRYPQRQEIKIDRFGNGELVNTLFDSFKGKYGSYMQRSLIESLLKDNHLSKENLKRLRGLIFDYNANWRKMN